MPPIRDSTAPAHRTTSHLSGKHSASRRRSERAEARPRHARPRAAPSGHHSAPPFERDTGYTQTPTTRVHAPSCTARPLTPADVFLSPRLPPLSARFTFAPGFMQRCTLLPRLARAARAARALASRHPARFACPPPAAWPCPPRLGPLPACPSSHHLLHLRTISAPSLHHLRIAHSLCNR